MRILVVRLGAMGDVIHALPAVAALGSSFPEATIGWVIEERWIELLSTRHSVILPRSDSKPLVDNIHTVNTRAWRKALFSAATRKASLNAIRDIRDGNYDVAIDFQGSWKSGLIAKLSGTPVRLGFSRPREHGAALFYTKRIATQRPHVIEQNLELAAVIGVANPAGPIASLPSDAAADARANKILKECGLDHFAIINPGAGWGAKCWPAESYAAVARGLCKFGLRSVINFGPAEEQLAKEVESASAGAAIALPCSIAELIAITKHAHIFVGGDTGHFWTDRSRPQRSFRDARDCSTSPRKRHQSFTSRCAGQCHAGHHAGRSSCGRSRTNSTPSPSFGRGPSCLAGRA
jgi:lipopolysaccharide heptosyltransferase I